MPKWKNEIWQRYALPLLLKNHSQGNPKTLAMLQGFFLSRFLHRDVALAPD